MTTPIRLRLSRAKGFDLQLLSRSINGLPARSVGRPSKWGNPYRIGPDTRAEAVAKFRAWIGEYPATATVIRDDLRGHNLACWCPLPKPGEPDHCHAAVLLEVANA
ncbi:DUF4326 domain-containing protein [Sediminicoccus sp. KRV36]|uniref:DUF4326 domain-containing protein n=1 Tax=Sediminicoccus sp. KRV36 TaxID=3133721 RepID=UPI00200D97D3|nr:DUF4326 domain-containing protein [Sediminicoccus rosea]UPY35531.1 DUF4326 domain-containing protein [Sediminicoccus rosea]